MIHWFTKSAVFSPNAVPAPVRWCRKVISHSDRYSIFKVQWKGLSLIPNGRGQMHPLNGKIFPNEKTSSLIWTKGAEMHTHFRAFFKKFLEKIYPFTYSHRERPNAHPESQKIFTPSLIWNWEVKTHPVFQKKQKFFLKRRFVSKISPHLFPLAEDIWGRQSQKAKTAGTQQQSRWVPACKTINKKFSNLSPFYLCFQKIDVTIQKTNERRVQNGR